MEIERKYLVKQIPENYESFPCHAIEQALKAYYDTRNTVYGETDRPVSLMDMAVIGAKLMRKQGKLDDLDVSEEINACSIEVTVDVDGEDQNNGWYNLKMKPITIQQKLNRLVALQLVLAAQFVILFQVELMFIRQCV